MCENNFVKKIQEYYNLEDGEEFYLGTFRCYFDEYGDLQGDANPDVIKELFYRLARGEISPNKSTIPESLSSYWYYELPAETEKDRQPYISEDTWYGNENDIARYLCGNCFLTRAEAAAHPDTITKMIDAANKKQDENTWKQGRRLSL